MPKKKLGLVSTTQLKNHESKNESFPPHFRPEKYGKQKSASWRFFRISASASCGGTFFELKKNRQRHTKKPTSKNFGEYFVKRALLNKKNEDKYHIPWNNLLARFISKSNYS